MLPPFLGIKEMRFREAKQSALGLTASQWAWTQIFCPQSLSSFLVTYFSDSSLKAVPGTQENYYFLH